MSYWVLKNKDKCLHCGKKVGDEARYGPIERVTDGICNQCWEWGES
jgi:hypothetical protein